MEGTEGSTVRLDRVGAGRDVNVSTTTVQVFVGTIWGEDRTVSVAPDGSVCVEQPNTGTAVAPAAANPYKGLEAFHEADAERFFGREIVIDRLWQRCRDLTRPSSDVAPLRLLPVIGPSGCGKSSLVRAGLLPELARRPLPGLSNTRVAVLVPGSHPVDALSAVLARMITGERLPATKQKEIVDQLLARDTDGGYHGLRRIVRFLTDEGRPLIVVVDQFEELWSLCETAEERAAFIAGLLEVACDRDARVSIVLTLRSDFLASTSSYTALSDAISRRAFLVPSMSEAELRRTIAEPARRAGFTFDEATIELMISETEGREGALPLLEFALTRIWEGLKANMPAAETLRQLGGVGGALAKEAERIYQQLSEADQRIARRAFLAQVRLGEGTSDSRRRAAIEEIVARDEEPEHVLKLLRDFSQAGQRFITLGSDPSRGVITAELSHEALLEHWDSLRNWIEESRDDLRFQRRLSDAVAEWDAQKRPNGLLWRSPVLDSLRAFHRRKAAEMTRPQTDFLEQSEQLQRHERQLFYGTIIAGFGIVLIAALYLLRQNYVNWEETRPWARLDRLSNGQSYSLVHETASIGRAAEGVEGVKHQVALPEQSISRIHVGISSSGIITDWRSKYGTTVNADWLKYGNQQRLENGDILVLAGVEALRYRSITWRPWDYMQRQELNDEVPADGWAILIDGRRRAALAIRSTEAFVTLHDGSIRLTDQPSEDAVLVVRCRVFRDQIGVSKRDIEALSLPDEDQASTNYNILVLDPQHNRPLKRKISLLTLQYLRPERNNYLRSSIKEGDYHLRHIILPSDIETVYVIDGAGEDHDLGEIIFETASGPFQIVRTHPDDGQEGCGDGAR